MVQGCRNWQIRATLGWLLITKIVIFLSRIPWTMLGQCLSSQRRKCRQAVCGGTCKLVGNCNELTLGIFCRQVLLKGSRKYFKNKVSSLRSGSAFVQKCMCTRKTVEVVFCDKRPGHLQLCSRNKGMNMKRERVNNAVK